MSEYGETVTGQRNFHAATWQCISCAARRAAEQSNHQCQGEDQVHNTEQEEKSYISREQESIF